MSSRRRGILRLLPRLLLVMAASAAPAALRGQAIPLAPEFRANTYTNLAQGSPAVASSGDGSFLVVWSNGSPGNRGIYGQRYSSLGAKVGSEFQVNTGTASFATLPSAAFDGSGGFVVVWDNDTSSQGQRFDSNGAKVGSELTVPGRSPQVAADATGNFVVVSSINKGDLVGQRFDGSSTPVGSQFVVGGHTVSGTVTTWPDHPAIVMSSAGDFVVVWDVDLYSSYPGGGRPQDTTLNVYGQRFDKSASKVGSRFQVNTYTSASNVGLPAIAADRGGNFVVVWKTYFQDGSSDGVFGQRFDSSAAKVGPEFPVNTYTSGNQTEPSVAVDRDGNFLVVWASDAAGRVFVRGLRPALRPNRPPRRRRISDQRLHDGHPGQAEGREHRPRFRRGLGERRPGRLELRSLWPPPGIRPTDDEGRRPREPRHELRRQWSSRAGRSRDGRDGMGAPAHPRRLSHRSRGRLQRRVGTGGDRQRPPPRHRRLRRRLRLGPAGRDAGLLLGDVVARLPRLRRRRSAALGPLGRERAGRH